MRYPKSKEPLLRQLHAQDIQLKALGKKQDAKIKEIRAARRKVEALEASFNRLQDKSRAILGKMDELNIRYQDKIGSPKSLERKAASPGFKKGWEDWEKG